MTRRFLRTMLQGKRTVKTGKWYIGVMLVSLGMLLSACSGNRNVEITAGTTKTSEITTQGTSEASGNMTEPASTTQATTKSPTEGSGNTVGMIQTGTVTQQAPEADSYPDITEEIGDYYKIEWDRKIHDVGFSLDVDGDGTPEKFVKAKSGEIYINGKKVFRVTQDVSLWILDIDRTDGCYEFLVGPYRDPNETPPFSWVYLYHYQTGLGMKEIGEYVWNGGDYPGLNEFTRIDDKTVAFSTWPDRRSLNDYAVTFMYRLDTDHCLVTIPAIYEFGADTHQLTLTKNLDVYEKPDLRSATRTVSPQETKMLFTDGMGWYCLEFEDGTSGYVYLDVQRDTVNGVGKYFVFDGFNGVP